VSAIFISYRGSDGGYAAGFVDERLRHAFGDATVFLDRRSLPPGVDFPPDLWRHLSRCGILLVLIGPRWLDSVGPRGTRRIDDPDDYVRREIRYSLERNIMVIPVILTKAKLPTAEQLPPDIAGLADRQYLTLRQRYPHDLDRLVDHLSNYVSRTGPAPARHRRAARRIWRWVAG